MKLHARIQGEGPPIVLLHGLFGSNENLGSLARGLAVSRAVYAFDLRNHGRSPHADAMDLPRMAEDVRETMAAHGLERAAILGHSLGGKIAMELALAHPEAVERLIVVDIAPITYSGGHGPELGAMRALDLARLQSRREADEALAAHIPEAGVRQFLLKNLVRTDAGFGWRIPLETIAEQSPQISAAPTAEGSYIGPALFIRGNRSSRITDEAEPSIRQHFRNARIDTVEDAGHWVHIEAPNATLQLVRSLLEE